MLVLLPPSETKRPGGDGAPWDASSLALPELAARREATIDALVALSADEANAAKVLKLSPRQLGEVSVNAEIRSSPTMPAVDRYTGVLFDALGADSLSASERSWLGAHVLIHSAPFGPVGALDAVPSYRLGAGVSLPGIGSAKNHWASDVTNALATAQAEFILDLRSEAYVGLGPVPASAASAYVRVVARAADGTARALNHFNKKAKGELVRALATSEAQITSRAELLTWGEEHGCEFIDRGAEIEFVTEQATMARQ